MTEISVVLRCDREGLLESIASELVNGRVYRFRRKITKEYGEVIEEVGDVRIMLENSDMHGSHKLDSNEGNLFKREVERVLRETGISEVCVGFRYLVEASIMVHDIGVDAAMITKSIYPRIAAEFNVTDSIVDHSMRNVIAKAWESKLRCARESRDSSLFLDIFDRKPSNLAFIKSLVMTISQNMLINP